MSIDRTDVDVDVEQMYKYILNLFALNILFSYSFSGGAVRTSVFSLSGSGGSGRRSSSMVIAGRGD